MLVQLTILDLHADNLLIALTDDSILKTVEQNEIDTPSPRKRVDNSHIYVSQYMLGGRGALVISDFGQARIGAEQYGNAMPVPYRAPEIILGIPWDHTVDTWSAGLLVSLFFVISPDCGFFDCSNCALGVGSPRKEESL